MGKLRDYLADLPVFSACQLHATRQYEFEKSEYFRWVCQCPFAKIKNHTALICSDHICKSDNLPSTYSILTCFCCDKQAIAIWVGDENFAQEKAYWRGIFKWEGKEDTVPHNLTGTEAFRLRTEQGVPDWIIDCKISGEEERIYKAFLREHKLLGKNTSNRTKKTAYGQEPEN
jgi:hypothetical protein